MNDDVKPWMQTCALDVRRLVVIDRATTENIKTIIARHSPKVDVEAIATRVAIECSKRLPMEANVEQGAQMLCVLAVIQTEITDELERALNHGK